MNRERRPMSLPQLDVLAQSCVRHGNADWAAAEVHGELKLVVAPAGTATNLVQAFEGELGEHDGRPVLVGPASPPNAAALRKHLTWLTPRPLGLVASFGFGDRLGLATPGHVRALREASSTMAPVFAQQSIREMSRTARGPQEVIDAATWGAFREGWTHVVGADADHLKHTGDIDACLSAGFTLFTIDPGDHVANIPRDIDPGSLRGWFEALPWQALEDTPPGLIARFADRVVEMEGHRLCFTEATLLHAAVKYGRAVAHVAAMYRHLVSTAGTRPFEVEVSVDETDLPTSPEEHFYVASELRRLGVRWVSLAPRSVGRFEKGVDYLGDPAAFEDDWARHAAIARRLGPYKLSLHSGSDKFSIYDAVARGSRGLVHVKTAGTSYLEALRTIAAVDHSLFRELYAFARERYATDRRSYHVSAEVDRSASPESLADPQLPGVLEDFHARQILHVTFGSVLTARDAAGRTLFHDRLMASLRGAHDAYAANLGTHFSRHLKPFGSVAAAGSRADGSAETT